MRYFSLCVQLDKNTRLEMSLTSFLSQTKVFVSQRKISKYVTLITSAAAHIGMQVPGPLHKIYKETQYYSKNVNNV